MRPNWSIYEPSFHEVRNFVHRGGDALAIYSSGDPSFTNAQIFDGKPHFCAIDVIAYEAKPKFPGEGNINVYHTIFCPVKNPREGLDYWSYTYTSGARVPHYPESLSSVISIYNQAFLADQTSEGMGLTSNSLLRRLQETDPTTSLEGSGKIHFLDGQNQFF